LVIVKMSTGYLHSMFQQSHAYAVL
jgi:hypothetical protein